jgi:cyclophilin family peptidyl-prolyl cis-trans isomerase
MLTKHALLLAAVLTVATPASAAEEQNSRVRLDTTLGTLVIALYPGKVPETVRNFLRYVDEGFYDGTVFHRVIKDFMIQGGGLTPEMAKKKTHAPIKNEAERAPSNRRGTIAMARTGDPHSATAQFFINTVDNPFLDHKSKTTKGWGYCVFGHVVEGIEVLDRIAAQPTTVRAGRRDVPVKAVVISSAKRLE